jgi:HemY protein
MTSKPIRWALWIFLLAALAVGLALAGRYGSGYAVFVMPPWRIEMSMMMFSLLIIGVACLGYALIRLSIRAYQLPRALKARQREAEKARVANDLHDGLRALFAGRFDDAEKLARRAMGESDVAGKVIDSQLPDADIRHLGAALAAWAAHEGGNLPAALPYLSKIDAPRAETMRDASKAYMLLAEGRPQEALPILQALAARDPSNIGVLKMKVEAEIATESWKDVLGTLTSLRRTGLMPAQAVDAIALNAEIELMRTRPGQRDVLLESWRKLESRLRFDAAMVDTVAARLIQLGLDEDAAAVLEEAIDKRGADNWDSSLVVRYADARTSATLSQIERAETWLAKQPRDAALLATLGKLCMRQALWGKAQSYLEASVALEPTLDAHMTLARLTEQIGKPQEAMRHIRRSAELARTASRAVE